MIQQSVTAEATRGGEVTTRGLDFRVAGLEIRCRMDGSNHHPEEEQGEGKHARGSSFEVAGGRLLPF